MKKIRFVVLITSVILLQSLISCDRQKEFEAELKTIDSCVVVLDQIDSTLKGIEFDSLKLMVEHVKANEAKIKRYYVSDTVDMNLGALMNNCKGVRKSLKDVEGQRLKFSDEVFLLRKQFSDLKTDILNGALDKEKVKEYLPAEVEALNVLNLKFIEFNDMQRIQSQVYYYAAPKIDEYVNKLQIPDDFVVTEE